MRRKHLFITLTLLLLFFAQTAPVAAKDEMGKQIPLKTLLKNARQAIKEKKGWGEHVTQLDSSFRRYEMTNEQESEVRYTQAMLCMGQNDVENTKAYLKQKYDTVVYFRTLLDATTFALRCDSTDTLPNHKGKVSRRYAAKCKATMLQCRPNLYVGARFYLRKGKYAQALPFLVRYVDMVDHELLRGNATLQSDTLLSKACFYATIAAYNTQHYTTALRYIDRAIEGAQPGVRPKLQEYKVRCYYELGDTAKWLNEVYNGCERYPKHDYFFTSLISHFEKMHEYDDGIELSDTMIHRVQDIPLYWYAKSLMYLHKEDWTQCIAMCDSTLARDSLHADALYNKGLSQFNDALLFAETACYDLKRSACRKDRKILLGKYAAARPTFERLRRLRPEEKSRWGAPLYRIYLNLNLGKEFDEMERILKE